MDPATSPSLQSVTSPSPRDHPRRAMTTYAYEQGNAGADRAVLLAHGAGSDLNSAALRYVTGALAAHGVASLRFNYPYRDAGKKAPDRAAVLEKATLEA